MMELKVWVDGIQRVVCGVTIETTCQDVVIALAHAMGRTGRFTLIEKWRDVERPLTPGEQPLRVLHKWGEYACEVKLFLCQNDTDRLKQRDRHKQPDRFSHNFSPPKTHADTSIKRNLTFSGAHNTPSLQITHPPSRLQRGGILENGVSPRSSSNSSTSSRSSPHPVPAPRHNSPGNLPRPAPRHSPLLNGQISALPNKPNIRSQPFHPVNNPSNSYLSVSSNFQRPSPPSPNRGRSPSPQTHSSPVSHGQGTPPQTISPSPSRTRSSPSNSVTPITPEEHNLDSPLNYRRASSEVEEYDLDVNFPDILRDSKDTKRPERPSVHTEYHLEESSNTKPEPERARLLSLVSLQTERLKVQESQLDVIETEIVSLEAKEIEYEDDLKRITDDLVELERRDHDEEVELTDLSSVQWVEVLGQQQQAEKKVNSEIKELKQKLTVLETNIETQKEKASELEKEVEKVRKEKEEKELEAVQVREEEEKKLVEDQHQLRSELELLVGKHQEEEEELEKITKEVTEVKESLKVKETELADFEADLKKVNLEEFGTQSLSPTHGKPAETGEAVLKILEGRLSPRPQVAQTSPTQQAFINSLASKNPNGVWV